MQKTNFDQVVEKIVADDKRYHPSAYAFVREGLDQTLKNLKRAEGDGGNKHVTGAELLDGLRRFTLEEFGPMGQLVLNEWGVRKCRDFGQIVFNLVSHNVLGRSESDTIDDFKELFTFEDAFESPFRPNEPVSLASSSRRGNKRPAAGRHSSSATASVEKDKSDSPSAPQDASSSADGCDVQE